MIKLDTVFVVGAGASVDYGFPLGEQLTKQIAAALNFNGSSSSQATELIRTTIDVMSGHPDVRLDRHQLFLQARALRGALSTASSIDAFLENHSENVDFELLGKLAIAACLITAERKSALVPRHPGEIFDLERVASAWLPRLFRLAMVPGVSQASIERIFDHVSFVVFNYDRCIEHYFEHAIASHFLIELPKAATIVREHLRIVHPYGDLGPLHGTSTNIAFGARQEPGTHSAGNAIYQMSQRLLTFTESKKARRIEAQMMISKAKRLVFLGFGFGEQNVELLRVPSSTVEDMRATVMGLSKSSQNEVLNRIKQMTGTEFVGGLQDSDCTTLINDEQMFLTRSV